MRLTLSCVLVDGSSPAAGVTPATRATQPISWPEGEDGRLDLVVLNTARATVDISAGQVRFAIREHDQDVLPIVSRLAAFDGGGIGGLAHVILVSADTLHLTPGREYLYDVEYIDGTGLRSQLVPTSFFSIAPIVSRPEDGADIPPTDVGDILYGVAMWPLETIRYFAVSSIRGNDSNRGYSDVSLAAAGLVAKRTLAALMAIIPRVGNGRAMTCVLEGAFSTEDLTHNGFTGYRFELIRTTGTNATAGCTAFDDSTGDRICCGARIVPGTNAAGYNISSYSTATIIGITSASPMVVTTAAAHGFATNDKIFIDCVRGINADGYHTITRIDDTRFSLNGTQWHSGPYVSGGVAYRWKTTLAGGGAPGFTDDNATLLNKRIRFDAATPTLALRNAAVNIVAMGVDTVVPDPDLPAAPAANDVFYIEEPAVSVRNVTIAASLGGAPVGGTARPPLQIAGLRMANLAIADVWTAMRLIFCEWDGNAPQIMADGASITCTPFYYAAESGAGSRAGGCTYLGTGELLWFRFAAVTLYNLRVANALLVISNCGRAGTVGGGCILNYGLLIQGSDCGSQEGHGGNGFEIGNHYRGAHLTSKFPRVMSSGYSNQGSLFVESMAVVLRGFEITQAGASPAIRLHGTNSTIVVVHCCGSSGNNDVGLALDDGYSQDVPIQIQGADSMNLDSLVTGSLADVALHGTKNRRALFNWTDFADSPVTDMMGVHVQLGAALQDRLGQDPLPCVGFDGSATIPRFSVVRVEGAGTIASAQADTAAHAKGIVGVTQNDCTVTTAALIAPNGRVTWAQFDTSGTHPLPAVNDSAFLAVDNARMAQVDEPPDEGTNQRRYLGPVVKVHLTDPTIAAVMLQIGEVTRPAGAILGETSVRVSVEEQLVCSSGSEELMSEDSVDFDQLDSSIASLHSTLTAMTFQSAGSANYRVRVGGTQGAADGTVWVLLTTSHNSGYISVPDRASGDPIVRPTGRQIVKLTATSAAPGTYALIKAAEIVFS